MKQFFGFLWGVIAHPRATFDELGHQSSIRPAVLLVIFTLCLAYLNLFLIFLSGGDWLGTRRELPDPTYVGFYGRLPVGRSIGCRSGSRFSQSSACWDWPPYRDWRTC